jgi:hypothetical protein
MSHSCSLSSGSPTSFHLVELRVALAALLLVVGTRSFGQSFSIAVSPHDDTIAGATSTLTVHITASGGFSASVFLEVSCPSLPLATISLAHGMVNPPYSIDDTITITLTGPKPGGTHLLLVRGHNGSLVSFDTVNLTVPLKTAWQVYNTTNSPIPSNRIRNIAIDGLGAVWIGTAWGLARKVDTVWTIFDSSTTFPPALDLMRQGIYHPWYLNIEAMDVDDSGHIWISSGGWLCRYSDSNWTGYKTGADEISSISIDHSGKIWTVSMGRLGMFDTSSRSWSFFSTDNSDMHIQTVQLVKVGFDNALWVDGTGSQGLVRLKGGYWTYYSVDSVGVGGANQAYLRDSSEVWFVDGDGASRYNGYWERYVSAYDTVFPSRYPACIAFAGSGNKWVGQNSFVGAESSGLVKFYGSSCDIYNILNSGLPDDNISCLRIDSMGYVWVGTEYGGVAVLDGSVSGYSRPPTRINDIAGVFHAVEIRFMSYPNPARTSVVTHLNNFWPGAVRVSLLDQLGRVVLSRSKSIDMYGAVFDLNVSTVRSGAYIVRVENAGRTAFQSLLIEH